MYHNRIIEIIGPPGVGKSTLYDYLCKSWNPLCNWTHYNALVGLKPEVTDLKKWLGYSIKKLINKKTANSIPVEYGMRFINEHKELANFCWEYLSDIYKDDLDKRYRLSYFLFSDFCKYQMISENKFEKPCIINEGLMQKSFFVDDQENLYTQVENYVSLLPVPYAVINMEIENTEVIINRILNRKKIIASHQGKSPDSLREDIDKWQMTLRYMVSIMERRGVKVFNLDGERPLKENITYLKEELNIS